MIDQELYDKVKKYPKHMGKNDLLKHLAGERITQRQAIRAKCYDCNGMGESVECDIKTCPIYPYSPYKV